MARYARVIGWGKYLPDKVLTNKDWELSLDTTDAWIFNRTGIREIRVAAPHLDISDIELLIPHQANTRIFKATMAIERGIGR